MRPLNFFFCLVWCEKYICDENIDLRKWMTQLTYIEMLKLSPARLKKLVRKLTFPGPHMPCAHSPIIRRTSTLIDFHCMVESFFCSNFFVHLFVSTLPHSSSGKSKGSQNAPTQHEHSPSIRGQRSSLWGHCVQVWLFTSGSANVQELIDGVATHVKRHRDSLTLHQSTLLWEQWLLTRPQVRLPTQQWSIEH